jgi:hypothetical protein
MDPVDAALLKIIKTEETKETDDELFGKQVANFMATIPAKNKRCN